MGSVGPNPWRQMVISTSHHTIGNKMILEKILDYGLAVVIAVLLAWFLAVALV